MKRSQRQELARQTAKEQAEHPWATRAVARRIAQDHLAINPADWARIHRTLGALEVVEGARSLTELSRIIQEAGRLAATGQIREHLRDLLAQTAINVARSRFRYQTECRYPPWDCAQEIVEFARTREETLFNPAKTPTPAQIARGMRKHCEWIVDNPGLLAFVRNPTTVARVGARTIMVFDADGGGHWAQVYDADGPVGAQWFGDSPEDALELAVERAHELPTEGAAARGLPSPGDTALRHYSLKSKLLR